MWPACIQIRFFSILAIILNVSACAPDFTPNAGNIPASEYQYLQPQNIDLPLRTSTPSAENINQSEVENIVRDILDNRYGGIDSLLIARNNALVLEEYFYGYTRDTTHDIRSATKSITSLLVGIAIDQGMLGSEGVAVYDYFSRYPSFDYWSNLKNDITLLHILNMSGGWECNDHDQNSIGNEARMVRHDDWAKFILDLPMVNTPGKQFSYCSGGVGLIGDILTAASNLPPDQFARDKLFTPLAITQFHYQTDPSGRTHLGGQMHLAPLSMLKIGQLVLNDGVWNGDQIISKQWIDKIKTPYFPWYKNLWWIWSGYIPSLATDVTVHYADGNGGQRIFVVPAYNLVVVFTAHEYNNPASAYPLQILIQRILPALT